jgi:hypothetical protein
MLAALIVVPTMAASLYPQKQDPEFQAFWTQFKASVAKGDAEAVAAMTKLPFLFDSKEHDRKGFIRIYSQLFDRKVTRCFATAKVLKEDDLYEVFCAKRIFYFGKVDGKYRFVEFGVDD